MLVKKEPTMPAIVAEWERICRTPPRVCWMCEYYQLNSGICYRYQAVPPKEFAETNGACAEWLEGIPF